MFNLSVQYLVTTPYPKEKLEVRILSLDNLLFDDLFEALVMQRGRLKEMKK